MPPGEGEPGPPAGQPPGQRAAAGARPQQARGAGPGEAGRTSSAGHTSSTGPSAAGHSSPVGNTSRAGRPGHTSRSYTSRAGRPGHTSRSYTSRAGLTSRPGRPARAAWRRLQHPVAQAEPDGSRDRFGLLLLILIASYLMSSFLASAWVNVVQIVLFVGAAWLALRTGRVRHRTAHRATLIAAAGSVVAAVLALTHTDAGAGLASLWTGLILLFTVALIVRRVLSHPVITLQSIYGAVSAYMILGLMFAAFYAAMNRFGGGFFVSGEPANIKTFQYFSFTTLTTLGYGDFTAAASGGRSVAMIEALFGQVFLATLVARLVAAFRPQSRPRAPRHRAAGEPASGKGRRGPPGSGPRRLVPGRLRSPRRRGQPGPVTRTSSRGHGRQGRR